MVLAVLLLLFPVTVHAEGELQVTELSTQGEITSDVNVRKGPSIDYDKIGTVRVGETIPTMATSLSALKPPDFSGSSPGAVPSPSCGLLSAGGSVCCTVIYFP